MLQNAATISVSNAITIAANGTLAGNTFVTAPALIVDGAISPGINGVGAIANSATLTLGPGGHFALDVQQATGSPGTGWDFLQTGGTLDIEATSANQFTVNLQSLDTGDPGLVGDFNSNTNYDWVIANAAGGIANFSPNAFTVNLDQFENDPGSGFFYLRTNGNSLILSFQSVPTGTLLNIGLSGSSLVISGTGGIPGNAFYVLASTNLTLPLNVWQRVATNSFDSNGNFSFTTPFVPGAIQAFYSLKLQ